jgi:hypothetical protein
MVARGGLSPQRMIWPSKPRPAHPAILKGRRSGGMPAGPWRLTGVADDSFLFFPGAPAVQFTVPD